MGVLLVRVTDAGSIQPSLFAPVRKTSQLARTPVSRTFNSRLMRGTIPPPNTLPAASKEVLKPLFIRGFCLYCVLFRPHDPTRSRLLNIESKPAGVRSLSQEGQLVDQKSLRSVIGKCAWILSRHSEFDGALPQPNSASISKSTEASPSTGLRTSMLPSATRVS